MHRQTETLEQIHNMSKNVVQPVARLVVTSSRQQTEAVEYALDRRTFYTQLLAADWLYVTNVTMYTVSRKKWTYSFPRKTLTNLKVFLQFVAFEMYSTCPCSVDVIMTSSKVPFSREADAVFSKTCLRDNVCQTL